MLRGRSLTFLLVATLAWAADTSLTEMVEIVREGLRAHTPDKSLAKSLRRLTLSERVPLRYVEELESEGAGPESVAALEFLMDGSSGKPASTVIPPFVSPARPSLDEQKEFFHRMDRNAIHYAKSLPDFICNEIVHRYQMKPALKSSNTRSLASIEPLGTGVWMSKDTLTVKLSYFDNHEKYELSLVNGKKAKTTYEATGGAVSEGEFGSTLVEVFAPDSHTKFSWDHWTRLRKRLTRVYAYRTARVNSHYRIGVGERPEERRIIVAGRHGFVYADDETAMVMRITGEAEDIPYGFPVTAQSSTVDFDYANVGEKRFLLPLRVDNRMNTAQVKFKNVVEFRDYRKFTGESSISFDGPPVEGATAPPEN